MMHSQETLIVQLYGSAQFRVGGRVRHEGKTGTIVARQRLPFCAPAGRPVDLPYEPTEITVEWDAEEPVKHTRHPLIGASLNRTAVACVVDRPGIGTFRGVLARQHHTGYIVLEIHIGDRKREYDIDSGKTLYSESGVAITELISDKGCRFYVQSAAGDVWAAIHEMPRAVMSSEVEAIHQAIA